MILYEGKDVDLVVGDIETLAACIDIGFYNPDSKQWIEFEISEYRNDLFSFIKFYTSDSYKYIVGFNWIDFDAQVLTFIVKNYEKWFNHSNLEIVGEIYSFVQKLIDDKNHGIFNPYRENEFDIPAIDVYRILGLDNEARRSSLKKCEFQMDYHSVEEMPIHHSTSSLTKEQIAEVKSYRRNDVLATYELLKIVIGDTTHNVYKGNNQIELRMDISKEFDIKCLNYSDIKIGEEILKHSYAKAIKTPVNKLPKKGMFRKEIKLKHCIPSFIKFETPELKKLLGNVRGRVISQIDPLENKFKFYGREYVQALGGLHSENRNEVFRANDEYEIHDYDVQSFYPAIIVNNGYYPYHLGKELLTEYAYLYNKRIELKPLAKKDKRIAGIIGAYKLALNAVFGKLGLMESWLYDKQCLLSVTLTGQFSLLMLIEMYETNGIQVISANTDGVTVRVKKDKIPLLNELNEKWQKATNFILDRADYKWITYSTVNDYIAEKITDDEKEKVKKKGDFITDFEIWKNKSARVVPLALEKYFTEGTNPIETIENHANIYDFCIMARATGRLHLELQRGTEIKKLHKLVRYYLSDGDEWQLYKRGIGSTDKPMNKIENASNDLGEIYVQYFNQYEKKHDYKIAYKHYILKCLKLIDKVEGSRRAKSFVDSLKPTTQLTLF